MNNDKDIRELDIGDLENVSGGVSPAVPKITINNQLLSHINVSLENGYYSDKEQVTEIYAFCKACGKKVAYIGQTRIEGGNTGQFKCTNPGCTEFNKIKYNDEVRKS